MNIAVTRARCANVTGAGPAALVAAITLAQRGWTINLTVPPKRSASLSRIDVLAGSALDTLGRLGITRDVVKTIAQPCPGTWSSWNTDFDGYTETVMSPYGHAWSVHRTRFDHMLRERAVNLGVKLTPPRTKSSGAQSIDTESSATENNDRWRILAAGCLTRRTDPGTAPKYDDKLIALVGVGRISASAEPVDKRLMIEAHDVGWAYGVAGPENLFCYGVITDAQAMTDDRTLAMQVLYQTKRIVGLLKRLSTPPTVEATPIPCRWLPLKADSRAIRIGDAQASFDPLAGRGLWQAIRTAEEVAHALDADPDQIESIERRSKAAYQHYLAERRDFYLAGYRRFGTGFWARRCSSGVPWKALALGAASRPELQLV